VERQPNTNTIRYPRSSTTPKPDPFPFEFEPCWIKTGRGFVKRKDKQAGSSNKQDEILSCLHCTQKQQQNNLLTKDDEATPELSSPWLL
jgi:hypothetical protein